MRYGFEIDDALGIAEKTYVNVNIHKKENEDKLKELAQLPDSCVASADCLENSVPLSRNTTSSALP